MHADVQVGPLGRSLFYLKAQCTRNISSSSNEVYPTTLWRLKTRHRTRALFQICDPFSVDCITVKSGYYFLTTELPSFDCKRVNPDQQFAITVESVSVAQSTVYFAIYSELHEEYCIGKLCNLFFPFSLANSDLIPVFCLLFRLGLHKDRKLGLFFKLEQCFFEKKASQLFYIDGVDYSEEFAEYKARIDQGKTG